MFITYSFVIIASLLQQHLPVPTAHAVWTKSGKIKQTVPRLSFGAQKGHALKSLNIQV